MYDVLHNICYLLHDKVSYHILYPYLQGNLIKINLEFIVFYNPSVRNVYFAVKNFIYL